MTNFIERMTRANLQSFEPYQAAEFAERTLMVKLNANELVCLTDESDRYYPDGRLVYELVKRYAAYSDVEREQVYPTRGGNDGIDLLVRTFCSPGRDAICVNLPTYGMYEKFADISEVDVQRVPLLANNQLDLARLEQTVNKTKLYFICSPNNPTGNLIDKTDIIKLLNRCRNKALVAVDEAYIDFCQSASCADLLNDFDNLVIIRTLSKGFGLAGIRCGFLLANQETLQQISKASPPYAIPTHCLEKGIAALATTNLLALMKQRQQVMAVKTAFVASIEMLSSEWQIFRSDANFVLIATQEALAMKDYLYQHDYLVRYYPPQESSVGKLRISIGSKEQMQVVSELLRRYFLRRSK